MNRVEEEDPFHIVRNYRKMIARRDRHHKKRKPKHYPPTSIKTRSMELKEQKNPSEEMIDLEHYESMPLNTESWYDTDSRDLMLMNDHSQNMGEEEMEKAELGLLENEKLLGQNEPFLFWDNDGNMDMNDHELLPIH